MIKIDIEDIFKLQTEDEIEQIYLKLNKDIYKYNSGYFHFSEENLIKYLRNPENSSTYRYNKFKRNWENFNNHKQLLHHFFLHNTLEYPEIFKDNERIIISEIVIDYEEILEEINVLKINKQQISYAYTQIITKLVKNIIYNRLYPDKKVLVSNVDILNNEIEIEVKDLISDEIQHKKYKLNKFLYKYQKIYPDEYKKIKANLIISKNYQDIFLSSTFKQWVSCMNLINTYKDHRIKYSNENYVKSGRISIIFDIRFK
jgi:hypothetical protein